MWEELSGCLDVVGAGSEDVGAGGECEVGGLEARATREAGACFGAVDVLAGSGKNRTGRPQLIPQPSKMRFLMYAMMPSQARQNGLLSMCFTLKGTSVHISVPQPLPGT